jgi:hypothetical protein
MSHESAPSHGLMEGQGAYNKYAKIPAGGAGLALPHLENAVRKIALEPSDRPVVIADYGSSQGKNSLSPIKVAIRTLRTRLSPNHPIFVFHIDQASNDFNTLFEVLNSDPNRYIADDPNVFACAIGRSFYENALPPDYVQVGWSSYAAVWLSRIPMLIPGHFFPLRSTGAVRAAFERQAAQDWEAFLSLRASELRPGGRLVVVLPGTTDDGLTGLQDLFDHANTVLSEMVAEGAIMADERAQMVVGSYPRRKSDLLVPFIQHGKFRHLIVEHCEMSELEDAAWADYERDGDSQAWAAKHARFFRAIFMPSLASALTIGSVEVFRAFADRLEEGLTRRLTSQPAPFHSFVQTIVLARQNLS